LSQYLEGNAANLAKGAAQGASKSMGKYYFQTPSPNLEAIAKRLVVWFKQHEYEVDSTKDDQCYFVQAKKTGSLRTLTGTNIAFKITLSPSDTADEFICDMATGKWTANIAGAGMTALFTGGATLLTGAMGAAWTFKVERDIVDFMESTLKFKKTRTEGDAPEELPSSSPPRMSPPPPPPPKVQTVTRTLSPQQQAQARIATELAQLEEACQAGILTNEELEAKKAETLGKAFDYEVVCVAEERAVKLKDALSAGILSQSEYETKLAQLTDAVRDEVKRKREQERHAEQLAKLKAARDSGVLTEEEYNAKASALG